MKLELDNVLEKELEETIKNNINRIYINSKITGMRFVCDWEDHVSEKTLHEKIEQGDVPIGNDSNLINFQKLGITNKLVPIISKIYPGKIISSSGYFHYPKTGYMSWHTNSDVPCTRVYITWAEEENESFFRYYRDGNVITDYDKKGLSVRSFDITENPPYLWHCVGSNTNRYSFGFRINDPHN